MATAGGTTGGPNLVGDFATGAFAALLATPCSAPFLGTAVAFALANGAVETFAIFAMLGLGLAAPYLLVAARPGLVRLLPKPGPWMGRLKVVLGIALLATAVWLLSVLWTVAGPFAAAAVAGLVAAGIALLVSPMPLPIPMRWRGLAAALVVAIAFAVPFAVAPPERSVPVDAADYAPFDRDRIAELVAAGEVVFVDVTADWCLTCKANKRLALSTDDVRAALSAEGTTAMQADWTRPDAAILAYLKAHGRYGIPFNAVYGPSAPDGIVLSELLTPSAVTDALAKAKAR